jgi:hypothetical protein
MSVGITPPTGASNAPAGGRKMRTKDQLMRAVGFVSALIVATTLMLAAPGRVAAATLKVCPSGCPYSQIGPALHDAASGDTIRVGPGTYAGGITIERNVRLIGAGAGKTIIKGGGPVVTIGTYLAPSEPTVFIEGVTVTGGVTQSSAWSVDWVGAPNVFATGGGIEVLPNADFTGGATLTITNSVITGNRVGPTATVPIDQTCPDGPCRVALAKGGGIDTWGALTIVDSTVSNNTASGGASDAIGGGIAVWDSGSLNLRRSRVTGNRAIASIPFGRFAEGGGIFTDFEVEVTIEDSDVSDNIVSLTSTLPYFVEGADPLEMNANGGGIHVGDGSTVVIDHTVFRGNQAKVNDPNGQPIAFDAAIHSGDGQFVLRHSTVSDNRVIAEVGSTADVGPSGSAIDVAGLATISDTRITDNVTIVTSHSGEAAASGGGIYSFGAASEPIMIRDSVISDNTTIASSTRGSALVLGAALLNDGRLVLRNDRIANNTGIARAPSGSARGGGIWNGTIYNPPPIELTVISTSVTGNVLRGSSGITLKGGGLFTTFPVTLSHSLIARNSPDNCFGCGGVGAAALSGSTTLQSQERFSSRVNGARLIDGLRRMEDNRLP